MEAPVPILVDLTEDSDEEETEMNLPQPSQFVWEIEKTSFGVLNSNDFNGGPNLSWRFNLPPHFTYRGIDTAITFFPVNMYMFDKAALKDEHIHSADITIDIIGGFNNNLFTLGSITKQLKFEDYVVGQSLMITCSESLQTQAMCLVEKANFLVICVKVLVVKENDDEDDDDDDDDDDVCTTKDQVGKIQLTREPKPINLGNQYWTSVPSDVKIVTRGNSYLVHKAVLCAKSPHFAQMLSAEGNHSTTIMGFDDKFVFAMLNHMYSSRRMWIKGSSQNLIPLANAYNVPALFQACKQQLIPLLNVNNAVDILILLDGCSDVDLNSEFKVAVIKFINSNKQAVMETRPFKKMAESGSKLFVELYCTEM